MIPIGKKYCKTSYNCAHFVSQWYEERLNITIPVVDEFDRSFVKWLRQHFDPVDSPENNCLVLMVNNDGSYHIGVYYDYGIYHNFKPFFGHGSVCKWTMGSAKGYYSKVSFHKWSESNTINQQ